MSGNVSSNQPAPEEMEIRESKVTIDLVEVDVAQYEFAKKAFFVLSPTASRTGWLKIFDRPVSRILVYALAPLFPGDWEPNQWKIAFELDNGKMITLELYDTECQRGAVCLVRTLTDDPNALCDTDDQEINDIAHYSTARRMKTNGPVRTVRDLFTKIEAANLLDYQLKKGRGFRF
ncbi:hypothetical protein F4677DRAFT_441278 [Hypoxylon crocopeplum]|nr:hypothetical protein F4677DRAFT_441278 [Hypoxylon crocopeplum]